MIAHRGTEILKMAPTKDDSSAKEEKRGAHLRVPDHLKKPKRVPTGKPTGRAPGQKNKNTMRAEQNRKNLAQMKVPAHLREPSEKAKVYVPTGKPRGRAPGQKNKIKGNKTVRAEQIANNLANK